MNFHKKTVLITSASSGIGKALTVKLVQEVSVLILIARRQHILLSLKEQLENSRKELRVITLSGDITYQDNPIQVFETLQKDQIEVDILINDAGAGEEKLFYYT